MTANGGDGGAKPFERMRDDEQRPRSVRIDGLHIAVEHDALAAEVAAEGFGKVALDFAPGCNVDPTRFE